MKTPEEIKKGLSRCDDRSQCDWCDLIGECEKNEAALAYIEQLESKLSQSYKDQLAIIEMVEATRMLSDHYAERLAQVERERDAAVYDINRCCGTCKHFQNDEDDCTAEECIGSGSYMEPSGWQWRGVCPENSKEASE